jgi:hypothetical protein
VAECRKIRYWKRVDALIALGRTELDAKRTRRHQKGGDREETRVYRCPICPGGPWHLSSRPR